MLSSICLAVILVSGGKIICNLLNSLLIFDKSLPKNSTNIAAALGQRAQDSLGQATGLGANAGQLLQMLAPIVMAFLAQRVSAGGLSADGLGQVLGQEKAQVQQQGGLGGGLLGALLDQDGDGQVGLSDLMKIGGSFLGGRR